MRFQTDKNIRNPLAYLLGVLLLCGHTVAQSEPDDSFKSAVSPEPSRNGLQAVTLDPAIRNVLTPNFAKLSPGVRPYVANFMSLWVYSGTAAGESMEWKLIAPEGGEYEIKALVEARDSVFTLKANDSKASTLRVVEPKWNRIGLGKVSLAAGENVLRLETEGKPFKLSCLELTRPEVARKAEQEAAGMRQAPDWFKDAGFGLMFQWTNRATPPTGDIKEWERKVDDFDLDSLVGLIEASGASFVVWSVTWGQQYISAPIASLDGTLPGRTSKRDLLGELADRLSAKGVRLIFYYHYGYDCYHSKDPEWMVAAGGYLPDKGRLFGNVQAIVSEIGGRYGDKLDGWFFDGGQRFYNAHFDGTPPVGALSAPFREITLSARKGNDKRIVCYNPWILPSLTEYQDFFAGEGKLAHSGLKDGIFPDGAQEGLMAFGCFTLESSWGHIQKNSPIAQPKQSHDSLVRMIGQAKRNRSPIAINLEMYEDGSVGPKSEELIRRVGATLKAQGKLHPSE